MQALTQQLQQSQQLVRQLESDLLALSSSGAAEGAGLGVAVRLGSSGLQGLVPAGLDAAAGVSSPSAAAAAGPGQEGSGGGDGAAAVLQAVAAQRDRFKARIAELEGEQAGLSAQLQQAAAQVQSVTQDNVALVEKLRCAGCGVFWVEEGFRAFLRVRAYTLGFLGAVMQERGRSRGEVASIAPPRACTCTACFHTVTGC